MMQSTLSILSIEDDCDLQQSITTYYRDCGYTVFEAGNGRKGLEIFKLKHPDLVVTDLRMPEMDGLSLIGEIAASNPDVPIIVISGTGNIHDSVEAMRKGAWDYVTKPINNFEDLEFAIKRVLRKLNQTE